MGKERYGTCHRLTAGAMWWHMCLEGYISLPYTAQRKVSSSWYCIEYYMEYNLEYNITHYSTQI